MLKADLIINSVGHLTFSGVRMVSACSEQSRRPRDNPVTLVAGRDTRNEVTYCSCGEETHLVEKINIPQNKSALEKFKYTLTKKEFWFESVCTLILCASLHLKGFTLQLKFFFRPKTMLLSICSNRTCS